MLSTMSDGISPPSSLVEETSVQESGKSAPGPVAGTVGHAVAAQRTSLLVPELAVLHQAAVRSFLTTLSSPTAAAVEELPSTSYFILGLGTKAGSPPVAVASAASRTTRGSTYEATVLDASGSQGTAGVQSCQLQVTIYRYYVPLTNWSTCPI